MLRNGRIDRSAPNGDAFIAKRRKKYQFDEGYCQATQYNATQDNFTFMYYDKDHLGNVRQVTKASNSTGTVMQTMNYYPFGAQFCDGSAATSDFQQYKYNGKELDKMHGLNTYDYGARQYNPVTARWDRMDPLAEKSPDVTPYYFCHGNPVNRIDPDGCDDYYTIMGDYVKRENEQTDNILIYHSISFDFGQGEICIEGGTPIEDLNLSAESYSKIFTNVLSEMSDVDITDLYNCKISVTKWIETNYNLPDIVERYNDSSKEIRNLADETIKDNKALITAHVIIDDMDRRIYSTVANVQNLLGVHEYIAHYKKEYTHDGSNNVLNEQIKHSTWERTTDYFKKRIYASPH